MTRRSIVIPDASRALARREAIRDPSTPVSEMMARQGYGSRLSRLRALGRDDNREVVLPQWPSSVTAPVGRT
jgi:hypothetical protein